MKKLLALLLALMITGACFSCFGEGAAEDSDNIPETEAVPPEDITSGDWVLRPLDGGAAEIIRYTGKEKELDIPEELEGLRITAIGDRAFEKCTKLRRVAIPAGITEIGANPFILCTQLAEIAVAQDHPCFEVRDGVLYGRADSRLICYPCALDAAAFAVPEDVRIIGSLAFCRNESLAEITIPAGVARIETGAFCECLTLKSVTVPEGITEIADKLFSGCESLESAVLPDSAERIGNWAFFGCAALAEIRIPDAVTEIGYYAFSHCAALTEVTVPDAVTRIGTCAFSCCKKLAAVTIPAGVTEIGFEALDMCGEDLTAFVAADSAAAKYCEDFGIPFEIR